MYRNYEGYKDPTAGQAMGQVMHDQKEEQKRRLKSENTKHQNMQSRKKIYMVSKYAGDVRKNKADAIRYCRYVISCNCMPIASHLLYPCMLRDDIPKERELGLLFGLFLLQICDEVWCFGEISPGMRQEITIAKRLGKTIRIFKEVH